MAFLRSDFPFATWGFAVICVTLFPNLPRVLVDILTTLIAHKIVGVRIGSPYIAADRGRPGL